MTSIIVTKLYIQIVCCIKKLIQDNMYKNGTMTNKLLLNIYMILNHKIFLDLKYIKIIMHIKYSFVKDFKFFKDIANAFDFSHIA